MTTDSANSERERLDLSQFEGHTPGPWELSDPDAPNLMEIFFVDADADDDGRTVYTRESVCTIADTWREEKNALLIQHAPELLRELTSLRACVSRKDEEIAAAIREARRLRLIDDGGAVFLHAALCPNSLTEEAIGWALKAAQPSGRCAEGREEGK